MPKFKSRANSLKSTLIVGLSVVLCLITSGCLIDVGLPESISYAAQPDVMVLNEPDSNLEHTATDDGTDPIVSDSTIPTDQDLSTDAFAESPDALPPELDASIVIADAEIIDSMVAPPIDPCRQLIIDSGFQLRGFTYEVLEGTTTDNSGCMPAINTDLLPTIRGSNRVRWTGDITADQAGYQLNISIPNLDRTGCTQELDWGGARLGGIETINLGIPVGQTPFVFEFTCSGSPPSFEVSFAP